MRIAYFDCFAGASGDMILGAIVDAGIHIDVLQDELRGLNLSGWSLRSEVVERRGLRATKVTVDVDPSVRREYWADVLEQLRTSSFSERVKADSLRIFERLFKAEARVHGASFEDVHLHEMGNIDTLIDVVGAAIGLRALGVEEVFVSAIPAGRGTVRTQHGLIPLPGPAVMELMPGVPMRSVDIEAELVTPTGAAILTTLAKAYDTFPSMKVVVTGYGAGLRDLPFANVLRLMIGETQSTTNVMVERVTLLETQVDDMVPEWYDHAMRRLFAAGALDVYLTPVQMKKNRPGTLMTVVCRPELAEVLSSIVLTETTTIGVRRQDVERFALPREIITVETRFGRIEAKLVELPNSTRRLTPEYEACRRVAEEHGVPLWDVYRAVQSAQ